jgi:heme/copper-type cytochrome/quinol oxidase subunit 2
MKAIYKKVFLFFVLILVIVTLVIFWFRNKENDSYKNQGEELVNKIEILEVSITDCQTQ